MLKVYADGDLRVAFGGQTWTFNPACLTAQPAEVDANLMTAENPNESGSKASAGIEGARLKRCALSVLSSFPPSSISAFACFLTQAANKGLLFSFFFH